MSITVIAIAVALTTLLIVSSVGGIVMYESRYSPRAKLRRRIKAVVNPGNLDLTDTAKAARSQRWAVQAKLKERSLEIEEETDADGEGASHIRLLDPDGNPVLIDQFF